MRCWPVAPGRWAGIVTGARSAAQTHLVPHSCRNRHCPLCQGAGRPPWLAQQEETLLPVPYFHLVFTLPHVLNPLIRQNQRALFKLFFDAASQTLLRVWPATGWRPSWGSRRCCIPGARRCWTTIICIALSPAAGWRATTLGGSARPPHYLFPVRALSTGLPRQVPRRFAETLRPGEVAVPRPACRRWLRPSALRVCSARRRTRSGWSMPSGPLPGRCKCWLICRATRIGWRSVPAGC